LIGNLPLKRPKSGAANAKVKRTLAFAINVMGEQIKLAKVKRGQVFCLLLRE